MANGSRRSRAGHELPWLVLISVAVMLTSVSCERMPSAEQAISGPARIGPVWLELQPPAPLRSVESQQQVFLALAGIKDWDVENSSILLSDGVVTKVDAWLVDEHGSEYELTLSGIGGRGGFYLARKSRVFPLDRLGVAGPDFPSDRTYLRLRIRSDRELDVQEIVWVCRSNT